MCVFTTTYVRMLLSFIVVTMSSRSRYEIIGLHKISHFIKQACSSTCLKSISNVSKLLMQCNTLAKQSRKLNILIYGKLLKFQALLKFCQPASQPAVRPVPLGLQIFQSAEDSSTAPPSCILTITGLPSSLLC